MKRALDELGYYLLAGAGGEGPATLMQEARRGEEMGFGTAFISERWNVKEASSLVGAACAVTNRMQIATAATNHNTRHPLITGSWATTMHRLSRGRFTLGIGRGVAAMYAAFGVPSVTTAQMEDFAQVMRRLWNGEVIFNHDGPIGKYQVLFLDPDFKEDIRLAVVAFIETARNEGRHRLALDRFSDLRRLSRSARWPVDCRGCAWPCPLMRWNSRTNRTSTA